MHLISPQDAQATLNPYHHVLEKCIRRGWARYSEVIPKELPMPSPRGKANMIHEFIINEARVLLTGIEGIIVNDSIDGRFLVNIENRVLLQFKKLNRAFETSNYPTRTARAFNAQEEIAGLPRCVRLTVGYRLNRLGTELAGIYILFGTKNRPSWRYDLRAPERDMVVELPFRSEEPAEQSTRIRPKRTAEGNAEGSVGG